eukprot:3509703-Rhodomonas_salina.1
MPKDWEEGEVEGCTCAASSSPSPSLPQASTALEQPANTAGSAAAPNSEEPPLVLSMQIMPLGRSGRLGQ